MVGSARFSPDTILFPVSEQLRSVQQQMREALDTGFPELDQCSAYVIDGGGKIERCECGRCAYFQSLNQPVKK